MNTQFFEEKEVDGLYGFDYGFSDLLYGCAIEMSPKHRTFPTYDLMEYKSTAVAKKLNDRKCF